MKQKNAIILTIIYLIALIILFALTVTLMSGIDTTDNTAFFKYATNNPLILVIPILIPVLALLTLRTVWKNDLIKIISPSTKKATKNFSLTNGENIEYQSQKIIVDSNQGGYGHGLSPAIAIVTNKRISIERTSSLGTTKNYWYSDEYRKTNQVKRSASSDWTLNTLNLDETKNPNTLEGRSKGMPANFFTFSSIDAKEIYHSIRKYFKS